MDSLWFRYGFYLASLVMLRRLRWHFDSPAALVRCNVRRCYPQNLQRFLIWVAAFNRKLRGMKTVSAALFLLQLAASAILYGSPSASFMAAGAGRLSLAGQWRFQLDREDAGVKERWFERSLDQRIKLPGALQNQGFGDNITVDTKWTGEVGMDASLKGPQYAKYRQPGNIKVPFFLQPKQHYVEARQIQEGIRGDVAARGGAEDRVHGGPASLSSATLRPS